MRDDSVDFFISRAGANAEIAKALSATLERAGHSTILQDWDFGHADFVAKMDDAIARAKKTITLLSRAYLASKYCGAEWRAVFAADPDNFSERLILFRIEECQPTGLLCLLAYTDLTPVLGNVELMQQLVLARLDRSAAKRSYELLSTYTRSASPILDHNVGAIPNFTGRGAELDSIQRALSTGRTVVVTGFGGLGKSALAVEFGYRRRDEFAGVWLIDATDDNSVRKGLIALGSVFIQGLRGTTDVDGAIAAVRSVLRQFGERQWLLIFDNVGHEDILRRYYGLEGTRILATSRLDSWGLDVERVDIGAIPLEDATRYLAAESGRREIGADQWQPIAKKVDCLPLALSHVAAYLRRAKVVTTQRCLERIDRLLALSPSLRDAPLSVYGTYQLAIAQAEEEAPGAASLMHFLSFFRGAAMPLEALERPVEIYPGALRGVVDNETVRDEVLGAVVRLSLAQLDMTERTIRTHVLVAAAARPANDVTAWYSTVTRALYYPLVDLEPGLERYRPSSHLAGMSYDEIARYIVPGIFMDLHASEYGAQPRLVALGIYQTWDVIRLSEDEFDRAVDARNDELERLRTGSPEELATFVPKKRELALDHSRRGAHKKAAAIQLDLCADIQAFHQASLLDNVAIEPALRDFVAMAKDAGAREWEIAAALDAFGYVAHDPFGVDALLEGVGLDEQRFGMSIDDVKKLMKTQASATPPQPDLFLHRVDASLVNNGVSRAAAGEFIQFMAHRMGIEFRHQLGLPSNCGLLGSDAEVAQCLSDALAQADTYAKAVTLFATELRRQGAGGPALEAFLNEVRDQFLLPRE